MEYRKVDNSGLKVRAISLGTWPTYGSDVVQQETAIQCLRRAIEGGMNFIDLAGMYSYGCGEELVGKVANDYKRSDLVISTKLIQVDENLKVLDMKITPEIFTTIEAILQNKLFIKRYMN